ncbi:TRAP transporter large permease subunit [Chelativorans sp. AA-79]|uniref:TRAP transporter large permease n=1 Tax=Chelativorans sp. AA-79 TaxID=3028735 RepID=UPI0023FA294A|nr:TRAP transporter large permease subunit [Chelativorans sp. AA-79]WEX09665.1 TRAP transporter large permease subunit [Chelativorans sp. AA-79]
MIVAVCFILLLVLLAVRVPIAISLALVSIGGIIALRGTRPAFGVLGSLPFDFAASWSLSAVPMFLLMGALASHTGMTRSLYQAARLWFNGLPGGLAVASNFASAGFAAASGSSLATAAAMGRLAIPEMLAFNYNKGLATATIAASGTLGAFIPPSIAFVLYGWYTQQPVGTLLVAGIVPGLLTAGLYSAMIILRCMHNPDLAPRADITVTWREKFAALTDIWPMPLLILCVVGGIFSGMTTATEAGAFGASFALLIALFSGRLSKRALYDSFTEAMRTTASLFFIAIGAILFTRFLAMSGLPLMMGDVVEAWNLGTLGVILIMIVVYLILGMFLDPLGIILLTLPIFLPMFKELDINLIWIGVLVVKMIEVGLLTPPVGMNAFIVKNIVGDRVPLSTIFAGLSWFLLCEVVIVGLLIAFPGLSLWLPNLM